jgi:tRNA threonylcarbamoyladenosine biosynthesis protein TsaE
MDAYRLLAGTNPLSELEDLDLDAEKAITVIEWGGEFANRISENFLEVQINRSINEDETRQVILISHGDRWQGFTL